MEDVRCLSESEVMISTKVAVDLCFFYISNAAITVFIRNCFAVPD